VGIREKILIDLENNCLSHLSMAYEYAMDWHTDKDDYSIEFTISELLYSFEIFKRALNNDQNQSYDYIKANIDELLDNLEILNFEERFNEFTKHYYDQDRYTELLNTLQSNIVNNNLTDNEDIYMHEDNAIDYFIIYDKINLLQSSSILSQHYTNISNYLIKQKNELTLIFNQYETVWEYFQDIIMQESKALLIPSNTSEIYWTEYMSLSTANIENILSRYLKTKNTENILTHLFSENIPEQLSKAKESILNIVPSLKEIPDLNSIIDQVFSSSNARPSFATYSKTKKTDDINVESIMNGFSSHHNELDNIINSIEELNIDDKKKKNLIVAIYILFDENDRAIQLSE